MAPNTYDKGDLITVTGTWTDGDGVAVDPATVALEVTDPSENVTTYTYPADITKTATGVYTRDIDLDEIGTWYFHWESTGSGQATDDWSVNVIETGGFNYDLSTDLGKLRLNISDTVEGSGPRPSDGNFTDEELEAFITMAGSWQAAVPIVLRVLANEWNVVPTQKRFLGYTVAYSAQMADRFQAQAAQYEGAANSMRGLFSYGDTDADGNDLEFLFGRAARSDY